MNKFEKILIVLVFLFFMGCGDSKKSEPSNSEQNLMLEKKSTVPLSSKMESEESYDSNEMPSKDIQDSPSIDIGKPLNPISDASKRRMLEYTIHLNYKIEDIVKSRVKLLEVVQKNSFIKYSSTSISSEQYGNLTVEIHMPIDKMYDTLLDLDKIGVLRQETIETNDHTESNEWQKILIQREEMRGSRRSKATASGKAENWTWKDREELLEKSEDNLDQAKFEAWKIKDKVSWVKVNLSLSKSDDSIGIKFPNYKDHFFNLINFVLSLTTLIVYIIPIIILGLIVFFVVKKIRD